MKKTKKITAILLALAIVISIIPFSVSAAGWDLQVATALEEGKSNYAYALADYNHDGIEDLFCIKLRNTGTKSTEIHVLDGSTKFASYLLQTGTALGEAGNAFKFVVGDVNSDGSVDVVAIMVQGTGSKKTEIHVLDGSTGYKSWLLQKAIPLNEAKDNCSFSLADMNADGKLDLYITKYKNTGSGNVELHVLSGKSNFNDWLLRTNVPLSQTDASTFRFQIGDYNGDTHPDLYAIKISSTSSKRVELHILNGHNSMQTFLLQKATILGADKSNFEFSLGDYTRNGKLDLYCIKKSSTGAKRTEVHVMPIDGAKAQGGTNNAKITYNYSASRTGHTTSDNSLLIINGIKITPGSTFYTYNSTGKYKTTGTSSGYTYAKIGNQYVNMNGWQCCAYARYVQYLLYGTQDSTGKKFKKIAQDQTATSASIEVWVKQAGVGAHIRSTRPHSFIVIGYDNNGFYYTDANVAGTNMVRVGYYTWKDFANCKYKNISYISYYVN